jgi:glycosyltransferase involved in cell wall biosynthesis
MRIVLAHSHANTFGGGERAVLEVARELGGRHEVRLLLGGFEPSRTFAELASVPFELVGRVGWATKLVDADAIVTNSFGANLLACANLLALRNGDRVAYWAHSLRSIFLQPGRRRPDLLGRRLLDLVAVRRTALLVANSHFAAARLQRLYGRRADAVVYPGVDLHRFQPGVADGGYAITVARLAPEKGFERLFELWRDLPDVPLHVVGAGSADYESELRQLAPANVRFRGRLATTDLAEAHRHAAIAVFAPIDEEFGIAALEAMACGIPVVAWREGGLVETVVDGQTGYLVSDSVTFRQRVRLVVHDAKQRRELGAAARQRAEGFSWQRTAAALENVCARLAAQPAAAPRT